MIPGTAGDATNRKEMIMGVFSKTVEDKIKYLEKSASRHERTGQQATARWYRQKAADVRAEAAEAQKPRRWGRG